MQSVLQPSDFHPFIRCVGKAKHLRQELFHKAYDYRMLVICCGKGTLEAESRIYATDKNEVYIISPGTRYRVISKERQDIIVINFDMTYLHSGISSPVVSVPEAVFSEEKIVEAFDLSLFFGENNPIIKRKISVSGFEQAEKLLRTYMGKRNFADDILLSALFSQLVCNIINENVYVNKNPLADEIYRYINENHHLALSLEKTAEVFHIHPTYLNRLLKSSYNTSFRQHLLKARFAEALNLIDNTDMTVKEIAERVGFNNAGYFSSAFFKVFGYYPTEYRK